MFSASTIGAKPIYEIFILYVTQQNKNMLYDVLIEWLFLGVLKFGSDIHGLHTMKPSDFGNFLTLPLAPPVGQTFHLCREISQH